ncbi:MAG: TonB-dependent receptor [Sphingobium sp.]|nr:TonB-dependent receptor [Sphingobium sp.]
MRVKDALSVGFLALSTAIAVPAFAQNTPAPAASGDAAASTEEAAPDIVVTAQFRETKLQDTPIAITAVNAALLEQRGQTNIAAVAAQAPNVSLRPQPQNGGSGLIAFIRGVGQVDFNYALDPGVGVYIDDVYIPTLSSSLLELIDLDRVEILRGPQGTLAGKNAIGGAIKLFSAKPKGDGSGQLRVGYGSYNEVTARGMMDFSITDKLAVRVSGMARGRDGYVAMLDYGQTHPNSNVPITNSRGSGNSDYATMGGQNIAAGRVALRWTPDEKLEINISGDYTRERSEAIPTVLIAAGAICSAPACTNFNPASTGASSSTSKVNGVTTSIPWLVGKNGQPVNMNCMFVPAGKYGCDTGGNLLGWDPRFVSYSNFMDGMRASDTAPAKPYFALPITNFNGWGVHGNLTYSITDDVQFVYIGSYRAYNSKFGQDQDATPIPVAQLDNQLDHHAFTSEIRLNFKSGDFLEGTVGGFYLDQKGTYTARVDLNYVNPTIDFLHGPDTTPSTTKALFGTVTLHPTEAFSITGGVRFTKDKKDYTYFRRNPDGTIPNSTGCPPGPPSANAPNCLLAGIYNITGSFAGDRWDWRIVGDYRFSDAFLAYASVSTGFKGGGVNPRPFVADQRLPFNPETLTTYEIGFKSDLFDRKVRLNGAAFFNKYNDIILAKAICTESVLQSPCLRPANIGKADVKGFELESTIRLVPGLTVNGSVSYLDFKYTSPAINGFLVSGTTSSGAPVQGAVPANGITPYTPKWTWSLGTQYDQVTDLGTFSIRVDGSYQGKLYTNAENTNWGTIKGHFLADGQISWRDKKDDWKIGLEVKNIFNKYYFQTVSDVTTSLGLVTGVPALPRTWSLNVTRNF